jgi:hypothetical protein
MVQSGYAAVPEAKQIDDLFGPAWHGVYNYTEPDTVEWQTKAQFGGRYELSMIVPLQVNRRTGKIRQVLGKPRFLLYSIINVQLRPDGTVDQVRFGESKELSPADWEKVVAAKGDFSVIGLSIVRGKPVANFNAYRAGIPNAIQMSTGQ